jgi:diguanylate cyclase (GGDEF)-like protein
MSSPSGILMRMQRWIFRQPQWTLALAIYAIVVSSAMAIAPLFYYVVEGRFTAGILVAAFGTASVISIPLMWIFLKIAYILIDKEKESAQSRADSERQRDILSGLLDASLVMQQKEDLVELLEGTIQHLQHLFRQHHFALLVYGRRRHVVRHLVAPGLSEAEQRILLLHSHLLLTDHSEQLFEQLNALSPSSNASLRWTLFPLWNRLDRIIGHMVVKGGDLPQESYKAIELFRDQLAAGVENHLLRMELTQLANTDGLTGVFNRTHFQKALIGHQEAKRQMPAMDFSLLMIDINGLKPANDRHGHLTGDQLIIRTAQLLKAACRSEDIVCRIGGDEFAILCPASQQQQADRLAERIREQMAERPLKLEDGQLLPISLSIGAACSDDCDPEQILIVADRRMYEEKQRFYAQQASAG